MNKKILSLAVAAAMVAPTAAMAEAVLYGKLHMSIDWASVDHADISGVKPKKFNGWGLNGGGALPGASRANRIGVKGSEDLGNGMKAIYQVEFGVQMTEERSTGNVATGADNTVSMRNTFAGLTGDWGTFVVGRNDTPFKTSTAKLDLFVDTMADYNNTIGFDDVRADNAVAYVSPSLSGFQLAAAVHSGGASTAGAGENLNSNTLAEAYSVAAIYANGPFHASLAYESLSNELFMNTDCSVTKACRTIIDDDYNKWRLGLGLMDWNGFTLTGIYEEQSNSPVDQVLNSFLRATGVRAATGIDFDKQKLWQIQAGYAFGNSMVKAMYGQGDRVIKHIDDADYSSWAIAFDHNLSKRTKAYVLYNQRDDDLKGPEGSMSGWTTGNWDGFSVGMIHSF